MATRLHALPGLVLVLWMLLPAGAQASHACPGGPGSNEVMVGEMPGGNGVAPVPLCDDAAEPTQSPQSPPASQQPRSGWWLPPLSTTPSSSYRITAIFLDPHGAVDWVTRPREDNALEDGAYYCKSNDPIHQDCKLLNVLNDTCISYAYTKHGTVTYATDADAQRSAQLAAEQCRRVNASGACRMLMPPICTVESSDPNLSASRIPALPRDGLQALTEALAGRSR